MKKNVAQRHVNHRWRGPHIALLTEALTTPCAVWLAVLVAVFFAIAPTLLHSLPISDAHAGNYLDICSAQKLTTATPDSDASATDSVTRPESASLLQHCPFCLHAQERIAPPPSLLTYALLTAVGPQAVTDWRVPFFKKIFALWLEPRGPPAVG
jgi:hypothetical protein